MNRSVLIRKAMTRKDDSVTENVNLQVHDDTAEATLGLWGTSALSPFGTSYTDSNGSNPEAAVTKRGWRAGETVLLLQAPGLKIGRNVRLRRALASVKNTNIKQIYLSTTASTIVDVNPSIPDADWLRRWSLRQKSREAINPPFPEGMFDLRAIKSGPVRCLFTIAELDGFARAAPGETFQGYMSIMITEVKLLDCWKRHILLSGDCCNIALYANATMAKCRGCDADVLLRLNPRILRQVIDETAAISSGKLLFSDKAWRDLLGREPNELLKLGHEEMKYLSDRLLYCRVTLMFGWTGDERKAGGRVCVLGVCR